MVQKMKQLMRCVGLIFCLTFLFAKCCCCGPSRRLTNLRNHYGPDFLPIYLHQGADIPGGGSGMLLGSGMVLFYSANDALRPEAPLEIEFPRVFRGGSSKLEYDESGKLHVSLNLDSRANDFKLPNGMTLTVWWLPTSAGHLRMTAKVPHLVDIKYSALVHKEGSGDVHVLLGNETYEATVTITSHPQKPCYYISFYLIALKGKDFIKLFAVHKEDEETYEIKENEAKITLSYVERQLLFEAPFDKLPEKNPLMDMSIKPYGIEGDVSYVLCNLDGRCVNVEPLDAKRSPVAAASPRKRSAWKGGGIAQASIRCCRHSVGVVGGS